MRESEPPVLKQPASPEVVLSVFQDQHRLIHLLSYDMLPRNELSFATTIAEWEDECDLLDWRSVGRAENEAWQINVSDAEWEQVFTPETEKTLEEVCRLIAGQAMIPMIREETFFGKPCLPASAFLTIRLLLKEAGADVTEVAPSTSLGEYSYQYRRTFLGAISLLAPGCLPKPEWVNRDSYRAADLCLLFFTATLPFALLFSCGSLWFLIIPAVLMMMYRLLLWEHRRVGGLQVKFGELKTFRDLSELIAASAPPVARI